MERLLLRLALLGVLVHTVGHFSAVQAQDADAVFERLRDKYDSLEALRAAFTQTMTSAYTDDEATSSGTLILQGERYRVETPNQVLVTDGEVTFVYLPLEKQVLVNDYADDETAFSPSEFLLDVDERFEVTGVETVSLDGARHYKLSLRPRSDDAFFTEAVIWVRDTDTLITRLEVLDVNETRMTFTLDNIELNPQLDPGTFTFDPPEGVEVVDLRS